MAFFTYHILISTVLRGAIVSKANNAVIFLSFNHESLNRNNHFEYLHNDKSGIADTHYVLIVCIYI